MLNLTFVKGRSNDERFVIKTHKPLSSSSVDFVRTDEDGLESISLVLGDTEISSQSGEITMSEVDVTYNSRTYKATEFVVKPSTQSLESLASTNQMELLVNNDKRLCFVDVYVE